MDRTKLTVSPLLEKVEVIKVGEESGESVVDVYRISIQYPNLE